MVSVGRRGGKSPRHEAETGPRALVPEVARPAAEKQPLSSHSVDRTANRHRWARRVSSGARENQGEGTRQNSPVSSEEGVPLAVKDLASGAAGGRSEEAQATVYQKHSTLPSRKAMYRV